MKFIVSGSSGYVYWWCPSRSWIVPEGIPKLSRLESYTIYTEKDFNAPGQSDMLTKTVRSRCYSTHFFSMYNEFMLTFRQIYLFCAQLGPKSGSIAAKLHTPIFQKNALLPQWCSSLSPIGGRRWLRQGYIYNSGTFQRKKDFFEVSVDNHVRYCFQCLPACERIENHMQMVTSHDYSMNMNYSFRIETSFTDLEVLWSWSFSRNFITLWEILVMHNLLGAFPVWALCRNTYDNTTGFHIWTRRTERTFCRMFDHECCTTYCFSCHVLCCIFFEILQNIFLFGAECEDGQFMY